MINVYGLLCLSCHDLTRDHIAISLLYVQMLALMDVGQTIKRLLRFFPFPKGCEGRCQELEVVARRAPWLPVILYCHPLEEVIWRKKKNLFNYFVPERSFTRSETACVCNFHSLEHWFPLLRLVLQHHACKNLTSFIGEIYLLFKEYFLKLIFSPNPILFFGTCMNIFSY